MKDDNYEERTNVCHMSDYVRQARVIDIDKPVNDKESIPESFRMDDLRFGYSCRESDLREPDIDEDSIAGLVINDAEDEEVKTAANNRFDALNQHTLSAANGAKKASIALSSHLLGAFQKTCSLSVENNTQRHLHSNDDHVAPPKANLVMLWILTCFVPFLLLVDITSIAAFIQGSGDIEFLNEGGYRKALALSAIVIIGMFSFKFWLEAPRTEGKQAVCENRFLTLTMLSVACLFISFALYYSGDVTSSGDSWDRVEEATISLKEYYKKAVICFQLFSAACVGAYLWIYVKREALKNKVIHVIDNPYSKVLSEKIIPEYSLSKESLYTLSTHEEFYKVYEAARTSYQNKFFGRFTKLKLQQKAALYQAKNKLHSSLKEPLNSTVEVNNHA